MDKSQAAFLLSARRMGDRTHMWTFTFEEVYSVPEACGRWRDACRALVREASFYGLRVFELHPGGHGVHVHVLTDKYFPVQVLRPIAQRFGFGRVNVIKDVPVEYGAKYLTKADRPGCFRGRRLWAAFGGIDSCKVKNIKIKTDFLVWYRAAAIQVRQRIGSLAGSGGGYPSPFEQHQFAAAWAARLEWVAVAYGDLHARAELQGDPPDDLFELRTQDRRGAKIEMPRGYRTRLQHRRQEMDMLGKISGAWA